MGSTKVTHTRDPRAAWAAGASSAESSQPKLATAVAARIVADIIERNWPVGQVLGSEPELLARYGVSRAVFREAVRLVEHQQIVAMRRGPGGGLIVTEPSIDAITDAVQLTLFRSATPLEEVFQAREVLESLVMHITASNATDSDQRIFSAVLRAEKDGTSSDPRALHAALASATKNPAIELFVDLLNRVAHVYLSETATYSPQITTERERAHERIVEAVCAGDGVAAERRMRRHLEAEAEFLHTHRSSQQPIGPVVAPEGPTTLKRGDEVARALLSEVVAGGHQPGDYLGSEAELMEQFGVSRAIIREAVQLLEHYDVAAMRRGPGGGLVVVAPGLSAVTDVLALYLEFHGIQASDVFQLRVAVELALVDLLCDSMTEEVARGLQNALDAEQSLSGDALKDAANDLHAVIAASSGNRVLELITMVLIRLGRLHEGPEMSGPERADFGPEVTRAHQRIVADLLAGKREDVRRHMRRHLEELSRFYS